MAEVSKIKGRKVIVERTGFKKCDPIPPVCARVYLPEPWYHDVAYGATERMAIDALLKRESVQAYIASVGGDAG
ncbi:hypothetical protein QEH52_01680 [Coraliomargarita sp. SDUM461003]|uniref:Uncharacterized protein n=1 Tax=Thalassobacterium maritimum TaxID=3041265 RepID=A0ABU1APU9_9BACT|nr:hypothetical protein [Coraliomargarita sp. SDUM461003]MDQ8206202.1 hypothetical protein [Coraliomargarita sp. SDUM461003]